MAIFAVTYRGVSGNNKKLGIKPTEDDRRFVRDLVSIGLGVRRIGVLMGERYKLGKPMSRMSLYYHHREDMKVDKTKIGSLRSIRFCSSVFDDMQAAIKEAKKKRNG